MNVAVIGQFGEFWMVTEWAADGWERNGHTVTRYDRHNMQSISPDHDLYFYVDCSEDYSARMPEIDKPKVFWAMDVQMPGGTERSVNIAQKVDLTFCTNYEHGVEIMKKFGIEAYWVQYGIRDLHLEQVPRKEDIDVCMIGHLNSPQRQALWELLNKTTYKVFAGQTKDYQEYVNKMANAKIIVNQATAEFNNIINLRSFEAVGFGGLLLAQKTTIQEYEKLGFKDGESLVYWSDFEELSKKLDYYLDPKNAKERQRIADNGKVLGEKYKMSNQIKRIEQIILSKLYYRLP